MSIKQFEQEFSKNLPSPVYLIYSSEDFLLCDALCSIKDTHRDNAFNFHAFDVSSSDDNKPIEQIVDILNTLPFLSERKVVVIDNLQKLPKKDLKKLEGYLLNPSDSSLLVMLYKGNASKLFDVSVLKSIKVIALRMEDKDIPLWIKGKAKDKGLELTDRATMYMMNSVGTDLGMLHAEIEKISSMGEAGVMDIDDIKGIVYAGAEYSAFDLVDALKRKDAKEVFRIFENMSKNMEPQMILGAINWQYSGPWSKSRQKESQLKEIFRFLHEADAGIKTSNIYVIESLLVKLLAADMG
ncbi:MAG: DNA polymerase III subunit delta [Thermodesulfovibrionales bacterium]|nr:DNA polymerase III subunit delta [Thermodesulfovibrionales bacterium]